MRRRLKKRKLLSAAAGASLLTFVGGNFACANLIIPPCQPEVCGPFPDADSQPDVSEHPDIAVPDTDDAAVDSTTSDDGTSE